MTSTHQQIVTEFVLGFFAGKPRTPMLESITRTEVCDVVLKSLLENGCFPPHADMIDGDPPMYLGEQIRRLDRDRFLVANIEFYAYAPGDGPSTRTFDSPTDAVSCFVRDRVSTRMWGIPVL